MQGIFIIIGIIVGYIVTMFVTKKYAQKVYNETGYNAVDKTNRFLMGCMYALPFIVTLASSFYGNARTADNKLIALLFLIPVAILIIRNLKAKNPVNIILLTLLQIVGGLFIVLLGIFKLVLRCIGLGKSGASSFGLDINTAQREIEEIQQTAAQQAQQQALRSEEEKQEATTRADAYAQYHGFEDADEAERLGFKTGKPED